MFNTNGAPADGGLVSSSALLIVLIGVLALFLTHRGISGWMTSRQTAVREHLYGPEELYAPVTAEDKDTGDDSENEVGYGTEPDDGFDYGIFATGPPQPQ